MQVTIAVPTFISILLGSALSAATPVASSATSPFQLEYAATPGQVQMNAAQLEVAASHVQSAVQAGTMDGAVLLVARHGKVVLHRSFGKRDGNREDAGPNPSMPIEGIFDLQSMTKILTSLAALDLHSTGQLDISAPVSNYIPEFASPDKAAMTVADLIRFTSGHSVDTDAYLVGDEHPWETMIAQGLIAPPRTLVVYSDLGYRLLGRVVEAAAGNTALDVIVRDRILAPLGMHDTAWRPLQTMPQKGQRFVGTGYSDQREHASPHRYMRGEVADDQDFWIEEHTDSVTGCDGVFSTAWDMALLGQFFLNRGTRVISRNNAGFCLPQMASCTIDSVTPESLINASMVLQSSSDLGDPIGISGATSNWLDDLLFANKGYGWELGDLEAGAHTVSGHYASPYAVSKIGGAGTFITVDPDPSRDLVVVLLTNHGLPSFVGEDGFAFTEEGALIWPGYENMLNGIAPHIVNDLVQLAIQP